MTKEFRDALEELTGPVHPGFRAALRNSLAAGRPSRMPSVRRFALAGGAAALLVLAAAAVVVLGRGEGPLYGTAPVGHPSPAAIPNPSPSPATLPAPAASVAFYNCTTVSGGTPGMADVTGVRSATQSGYDRFVIEFTRPVPSWTVVPQASTAFTEDASGRPFTVAGTKGILVRVTGATAAGGPTWSRDDLLNGPGLREARLVGDFERVYQWALGVQGSGCFHAYTLTRPDRLVVDVPAPYATSGP